MQRFADENKRLSDFYDTVLVQCPRCSGKATATANREQQQARLICTACGFNAVINTTMELLGQRMNAITAAHAYFGANLWLTHPFKENTFWAYNEAHLLYLEKYIAADLREHKDRTHFTLLEKLPRFYHQAANRQPLLKIIGLLKEKLAAR